jgi:CubicO group peptidase (beta-lactamase class C family)
MADRLDVARLRARVSDLLVEHAVPSAAIGVLHGGRVTELATGVASAVTRRPATTDTAYQIGSITKTWTALAFLQLVGEGRVGLDDPVRAHLPGFRVADPETTARVTPRHLLNHTGGIEESYGSPGEGDDVYRRMVAAVAGAPQVHPLGATHGYSTALGSAILARILEVVDDRPWDAVMRARLFEPLGLTRTTSRPDEVDRDRTATGHLLRSLDEGPVPSPVPHLPRAFGPGGAITSTAREVLAMAHLLLDGGRAPDGTRVVPAGLVAEMTSSRVPVPDPYVLGPEWGLGLVVDDWQGRTVLATDGSTIGQHARLRVLPELGLAVVMLTNGGPRAGFSRAVFDEVLTGLGAPTVPPLPGPDPGLVLDPARYVGCYARPDARFEVTAEDGRLHLTFVLDPMKARVLGRPQRLTRLLLPISETRFLVPSDDPLEDTQTAAIYGFEDGVARYLHTNCRVHPRLAVG